MKRRTRHPTPPLPLVRLIQLPANRDAEGEPRVAVSVTPPDQRPEVRTFVNMQQAIAFKRRRERGEA